MTVKLRSLERTDHDWLDHWFAPVAQSFGYEPSTWDQLRERNKSLMAKMIVERDEPRGLIVYRLHTPRSSDAIIEIVALPPAYARRGLGMSAATLVEERLRRQNIKTMYTPVAARHGISMYFWIRLGYHPLLRAEWPCERAGVAWLARDL